MKNLLQLSLVLLCSIFSIKAIAQQDKTMFVFGHSLIVHATSTDETTVPHWLHHLAEEESNSIAVSGQYGFLASHANLPPISQWGFGDVAPAWDSDTENFEDIGFDTFLITPANFVQYRPSNLNYEGGASHTSPLLATLTILDWIDNQEPEAISYIYENWPDMGGFIAGESFPPSVLEYENYTTYTQGDFHDWWIDYHDFIQVDRPSENVRLIPVGSIISKLLTQAPLNQIPVLDLYEDNAPHGRPTIYFLAGLITYMAIYEQKAPDSFVIPNTVSAFVRNNYESTINFIWEELLAFNDATGNSRVFANNVLSVESDYFQEDIAVYPNPTRDIINIKTNNHAYSVDMFDIKGIKLSVTEDVVNNTVNISNLPNGVYFLRINSNGTQITRQVVKH